MPRHERQERVVSFFFLLLFFFLISAPGAGRQALRGRENAALQEQWELSLASRRSARLSSLPLPPVGVPFIHRPCSSHVRALGFAGIVVRSRLRGVGMKLEGVLYHHLERSDSPRPGKVMADASTTPSVVDNPAA